MSAGHAGATAAAWAGVAVALLAVLLSAAAMLVRGARRDGRVDEVLERLTGLAEDHEARLRVVEDRRAARDQAARRGGR
jgi:hypothetical protein